MPGDFPMPPRLFAPVSPLIGLFFSERDLGFVLLIEGAEPLPVTLLLPALLIGLLFSLPRCFFTEDTRGELPALLLPLFFRVARIGLRCSRTPFFCGSEILMAEGPLPQEVRCRYAIKQNSKITEYSESL